jgi:hypothetical protein
VSTLPRALHLIAGRDYSFPAGCQLRRRKSEAWDRAAQPNRALPTSEPVKVLIVNSLDDGGDASG